MNIVYIAMSKLCKLHTVTQYIVIHHNQWCIYVTKKCLYITIGLYGFKKIKSTGNAKNYRNI